MSLGKKLNCVLLIDDDSLTNNMNRITIDEANCSHYVIRKKTVLSGLKYLADSASKKSPLPFPDLIFLDISMPELSGWNFMDHFETIQNELPGKPVIYMLTALPSEEEIKAIRRSSALSGFCEKPLTPEKFQAIINQYFVCP